MAPTRNYILDQAIADRKLRRMALEIVEQNHGQEEIILAGIREKGFIVAQCLHDILAELSEFRISILDISLDKKNPGEVILGKHPDMNNKVVIIVDDVVNTGKTLTYALKPFLAFHPKKIQILVLVERTHTHFPVRPDYVGLSIATTIQEQITVEIDGKKVGGAYLM